MIAIFKREFKSYFQNVIGWLYIAATIALYGVYFFAYNLQYGYAKVSYPLSGIMFILLITVPVLTMRSLAEEQKSKTDQLILTSPVSVGKIVMAKYFAMAAVHTLAMAIIALTPLLLMCFGTVPVAENYVAILGFWLYGLTCIAIGLFVSSITESQVISAVLTFVFLFFGFMMKSIVGLFSTENIITKVLSCYDLMTPVNSFMQGCLSLTGVIYYVTITALFLFLTTQSIQKRRFTISVKKLKLGVFNAGFVAVAVALAVFVNLFAMELPSTYMEIDVTSSKLYSITEDTKAFLKDLKQDVTIYVVAAEDTADTTVAETLKRYEDSSSHIKVEYKDPAVNPNFYQEYTEDAVSVGSIIVVCGEVSKVIDYYELFETTVDYETYSQQTTGYDGEGQITSALQYVTNEDMPAIYQITGHGEVELSGDFLKAVEKSNVTLNTINLLEVEAIPEDAKAVIINGPSADFSKDDADKVIAYMQAGGNVFVTANYEAQNLTNFSSILAEYDMSLVEGIVAEGDSTKYYQNPFYLLPDVAATEYTGSVQQYVFVPYTQGITYPENAEGITYTPLLTTSEQAVSKTNAANATSYEFEEGDVQGPFHVAVAATKTASDSKEEAETAGQLVVFGAMDIFTETADQMVAGSNAAMFSDVLATFVDSDGETSIVIPAKSYEEPQLVISAWAILLAGISVMVLLPVLCLLIGVVVWAKRRKR